MRLAALALAILALLGARADAQSVADFYRGKNVTLSIGYSVGGGYDLYGRLVARHLGKHIPGNPVIVPQNMTGAGSLRAAQYLYSVAPRDGTAIGTFGRTIATTPLLAPAQANFDATKFTWLGSVTNEVSTCATWYTSRVKTWKDILTNEVTFGGLGPGADPDVYATLYKNVFGAKIRLVTGYPGTTDAMLAMERGEVDGLCGLSWSTITARHEQALRDKKINILVQAALRKQPELPDVPLATELTQDREQQQILKIFLSMQEPARPFTAPPDIPADRKAALIAAFDATMKDADFLAEAKKQHMDVNPLTAKGVEEIVAEVYSTPKAVLDKAALAISK
jgi:tripartite-type tricarboxylate transporter receptor subunit TctC